MPTIAADRLATDAAADCMSSVVTIGVTSPCEPSASLRGLLRALPLRCRRRARTSVVRSASVSCPPMDWQARFKLTGSMMRRSRLCRKKSSRPCQMPTKAQSAGATLTSVIRVGHVQLFDQSSIRNLFGASRAARSCGQTVIDWEVCHFRSQCRP